VCLFIGNKNKEIVRELIQYITKVKGYCNNVDYASFVTNEQLHEACVFHLLQIGESANRLNDEFTSHYLEIPWIEIRGLRNRIAHDYQGICIEIIWNIIQSDLEPLREQLLLIESQLTK
jgi:uncharacterized protein with HEPN domain